MALPILQNIATVFGAAVPAYQEARNFVMKSQQAALDYRIAVAELLIRARTQELANAARMRAAATDAIDTVRRYALDSPEYTSAMAEVGQANVPQEQINAIANSFEAQGFITEDQLDRLYDFTKGDRPDDGSGRGGSGRTPEPLDQWLEFEIGQRTSLLSTSRNNLQSLLDERLDASKYENMAPEQQDSLDDRIAKTQQLISNLEIDYDNLYLARDYARKNEGVSLDEVLELFPLSRYNVEDTVPTPTVSTPTRVGNYVLNPPPAVSIGRTPDQIRADSAAVDNSIQVVAPQMPVRQ